MSHEQSVNPHLSTKLLYLSQADVSSIGLTMEEIISALEFMFREKAEGRVEMPPKIGIHTMPDAFIHAMPAAISAQKAAGMKWVGGYPANSRRGLPYITGLLILNDYETGIPARCTGISFSAPESPEGIRTGYPLLARLAYKAFKHVPDAVFRVSIYWPSGYLCAQLTTESLSGGFQLEPGTGVIEFQCPTLPVVPGLYRVDLAIESKGLEIDVRQRCATLRVEPGKIAYGDFLIENTWKITETLPQPRL